MVHVIEEKVGDFAVGVKDVIVAADIKLGEAINTVAEKVAEVLFPEPIREDIEKEVLDADLAKILAEKKLGSANIKLEDRPLVSTFRLSIARAQTCSAVTRTTSTRAF